MQNIATIYRFNTPFLEFDKEKNNLIWIQKKISDYSSDFEWIVMNEETEDLWKYIKIKLKTSNNLVKFNFYYLKVFNWNYYAPVFKLDIFIDRFRLTDKIVVWFLINVFECFDWLDEKEYLIDLDNTLYYRKKLVYKVYPVHDFTDIDTIKQEFEDNKWNEVLENFIERFSKNDYKLTVENSDEYYKIHSIVLYYIYLVYSLYQSIVDSNNQLKYLEQIDFWEQNPHKELMQERLKHVNDLSLNNFKNYYERLELFFKLFN